MPILAFGLPGVIVGANVILSVPERAAEMALGMLTAGLGIYSWLNPELGQVVKPLHRDRRGALAGGLVLFGIGVLNGSLTSGTGLFVTMWLARWFGLDYRSAIAYTLILVGVFWNGTGALTLGLLGGSAGPGCRPFCWDPCSAATWARIWRSNRATAGSSVPLNW
jgi:hypothetical protein